MKRFIRVLMLVCMIACLFTVSAYADGEISNDVGIGYIGANDNVYLAYTQGAYGTADYREAFLININSLDGNVIAKDSIVVELYNGSTLLSKTVNAKTNSLNVPATTCSVVLSGDTASSWNTQWAVKVTESNFPTRIRIITDNKNDFSYNVTARVDQQFTDLNPEDELVPLSPTVVGGIEPDPIGVNYKTILRPAIKGQPGDEDYRERLWAEIGIDQEVDSFVVKVYAGDTLVSQAEMNSTPVAAGLKTVNMVLEGKPSSSWNNTVGTVAKGLYPTRIELWLNGEKAFEAPVEFSDEWKEIYDSFSPHEAPPANPGGNGGASKPAASNPYSVPSTADNSNVALWSLLFVAFAAVAVLTAKKRKA